MGAREPSQESVNEVLIRPQPISLSQWEIGDEPRTKAEKDIEVEAWVRFPEFPIRVRGRALEWNSRAVFVEFQLLNGANHHVWIWNSAARRTGRR